MAQSRVFTDHPTAFTVAHGSEKLIQFDISENNIEITDRDIYATARLKIWDANYVIKFDGPAIIDREVARVDCTIRQVIDPGVYEGEVQFFTAQGTKTDSTVRFLYTVQDSP